MTYAWDEGVRWFSRRTGAPTEFPLDLSAIGEKFLRDMADGDQDAVINGMVAAAVQAAEDTTCRALMPQTWQMVLDRFPCGRIVLERPPFIGVTSLTYFDTDNVEHELAGSPVGFQTVSSGAYSKAMVLPLADETWPSTYSRPDAVTVTYEAGYEDEDDPVLKLITAGILVMVGELYRQRTLSIVGTTQVPSALGLRHFWRGVR